MLDGEMIAPIDGSDGKYWITNFGRVFRAPCLKRPNWYEMNGESNHGYLRVKLSIAGNVDRQRIHRIVAQTFIKNPENKPAVNHLDGNKKNNRVDNLEWCTHSENEYHSYRTLGKVPVRAHPECVALKAVELRKSGVTIRETAERLGVSETFVKRHCRQSRDIETRIKRIKE